MAKAEGALKQIEIERVDSRLAWTWFIEAVTVCYQRPELAIQQMLRYRRSKGEDALLIKLALDSTFFGLPRPVPSRSSLSWAASGKEIRQARNLLSLLAMEAFAPHAGKAVSDFHSDQNAGLRGEGSDA
ncbi:hypothetical protein [Bradyrhizobium cajani]|uniref:Uncharacterized protein n=1 Tax=Bradyrhizobium cajani TaxID=1928661 RepID=A0A844T912_9BRAD|nr:hypothetical protein [Bradyrhizobium cajani]MCP3368573.1 hypothetical protein [Bradyrhizobium cajani]MVT75613.1 hypothetical protein [Bradyrhizobium cajani]